jgi:hypothetical protein
MKNLRFDAVKMYICFISCTWDFDIIFFHRSGMSVAFLTMNLVVCLYYFFRLYLCRWCTYLFHCLPFHGLFVVVTFQLLQEFSSEFLQSSEIVMELCVQMLNKVPLRSIISVVFFSSDKFELKPRHLLWIGGSTIVYFHTLVWKCYLLD